MRARSALRASSAQVHGDMRAVFGADKLDSGEIYVKGEKVHIRTPKDAIKREKSPS